MMVPVLTCDYTGPEWSVRGRWRSELMGCGVSVTERGVRTDHITVKALRQRHLGVLAGLFVEALQSCQKAGLVKMGHVEGDGSKHTPMSYERTWPSWSGSPNGGSGCGPGGLIMLEGLHKGRFHMTTSRREPWIANSDYRGRPHHAAEQRQITTGSNVGSGDEEHGTLPVA
jgi:hypothetical protein